MTEHTGEQVRDQTDANRDGGAGSADSVRVVDNPEKGRFELRDGDEVIGVAAYTVVPGGGDEPDRMVLFHTEVSPEHEGQGLGARLASYALERTVSSGRAVVALCP